MRSATPRDGLPVLYHEHLLLGATFGDNSIVERYGSETDGSLIPTGAVLADVSDMSMLLFAGRPAPSFATTAFAGSLLEAGECGFQAVLSGDGSLVSIPLLARTGASEYVVADLSARGDVLDGWLSFLSAVEHEGVAPFASIETEDVAGTHVALVLAGPAAAYVLGDYVSGGRVALPAPGKIEQCLLDRIPCIVAHPYVNELDAYLLLVPPVHAVQLWRSLLSFTEVSPIGRTSLRHIAHSKLPWSQRLQTTDATRLTSEDLASANLVRNTQDFVGARGLFGKAEGRS